MPTEISHPEFDFSSPREWQKLPSNDASRVVLRCPEAGTTITLTMDAMAIPADKLEEVAKKVLDVRKETHRKAAQSAAPAGETVKMVFGDERLQRHASGQAWELSYLGTQAGKNIFAFLGYVTSRKIAHLYIETSLPVADGEGAILKEVLDGFKILVP